MQETQSDKKVYAWAVVNVEGIEFAKVGDTYSVTIYREGYPPIVGTGTTETEARREAFTKWGANLQ